jgi:hypothetical protein
MLGVGRTAGRLCCCEGFLGIGCGSVSLGSGGERRLFGLIGLLHELIEPGDLQLQSCDALPEGL